MTERLLASLAVSFSALFLLGCSADKGSRPGDPVSTANLQTVTVHVKEMSRRLALHWLDWPNRVEKALSGLRGVRNIDVDLEGDLLHVQYDPKQTGPQAMLEVVAREGLEGTIVPDKKERNWLS